jgi:hypothetical protein
LNLLWTSGTTLTTRSSSLQSPDSPQLPPHPVPLPHSPRTFRQFPYPDSWRIASCTYVRGCWPGSCEFVPMAPRIEPRTSLYLYVHRVLLTDHSEAPDPGSGKWSVGLTRNDRGWELEHMWTLERLEIAPTKTYLHPISTFNPASNIPHRVICRTLHQLGLHTFWRPSGWIINLGNIQTNRWLLLQGRMSVVAWR